MADTDAKMEPSRPRPVSLPNELLLNIFERVRENLDYHTYSTLWTIQAIRQTCRLFNELSSHLLLHNVKVDLTRSSLAHLDEVSRHPLISKGIKSIHLYLTPFYNPDFAYDIRAFAAKNAYMQTLDEGAWDEPLWSPTRRSVTVHPNKDIVLWEEIADGGLDTSRVDHLILLNEYKQYLQLYKDYEDTAGSFTRVFTSAMMRMTAARRITIDDYTPALRSYCSGEVDDADDQVLWRVDWATARYYGLGQPPLHLIGELILSIKSLGLPLESLDVGIPPVTPWHLPLGTTTSQGSKAAQYDIKGLTAYSYQAPGFNGPYNYQFVEGLGDWAEYVLSPLYSKSLQKVYLNLDLSNLYIRPQLNMCSFLLSYTWPKLQQLSFKGPFHIEELRAVVKPLRQDVNLTWTGYLRDGSWADALDFLRERNTRTQTIGPAGLDQSYGQEYDLMRDGARRYIFGCLEEGIAANQYIRGLTVQNPVTAWQMGVLDIPDEFEWF